MLVMYADSHETGAERAKRRWFQVRLRSMFVFTLICAIPCAWIGRRIEQKHREREAVTAILKDGGDVHFDYQFPSEDDARTGVLPPRGPAWLRAFFGENFFSSVTYVHVRTDAGLGHVAGLCSFRRLDVRPLSDSSISLGGLETLKALSNFDVLEVGKDQFNPDELEHLRKLLPFCEIWH
jgi:hypothetical protein